MKKIWHSALTLLLLPAFTHAQNDITGDWHGALDIMGTKLRIVFHLTETDGVLSATLDSPDQGAFGLPVSETKYEHPELTLEMPNLMATFKGKVNEDFTELNGTFLQRGMSLPLNLQRQVLEKQEVKRPQEPVPPFPYSEEEVTFENTAAGVSLAGTLTLPEGEGPFPAVALVSGSGPQDRNEELLDHKPFLIIADYLTRKGIAVLRYDDRGVGASTGDFSSATSEDFATDALAAVNFLKTRTEMDAGKIGIVGHSEGGLIAPMVASQSEDVAFIVLLAGPGTTSMQLLLRQIELLSRAEGESEEAIARGLQASQACFEYLITQQDTSQMRERLAEIMGKQYDESTPDEQAKMGSRDNYVNISVNQMTSPWFRFFIRHNPAVFLEKTTCPVLALNGEKDLQVPPKENLEAIKKALRRGGNLYFRAVELQGLNHLFQTCETGSPGEYGKIEETFSPVALKEISDFILSLSK